MPKYPPGLPNVPAKREVNVGRIWYEKCLPLITWNDVIVRHQSKKPKATKPIMFAERFDGLKTRIGISISRG